MAVRRACASNGAVSHPSLFPLLLILLRHGGFGSALTFSLLSSFLTSCFLTFCSVRNEAMVVYLRMR
ncbi:hypothetical protein K456DRAFT_1139262 [Colletotrichum gloeosporioides 23]|nr:hypothetical protein K456DRAFT_1139262 [Colletotrichum gloeosporioides 23]